MDTTLPTIDDAKLNDFGLRLFRMFEQHEKDRKPVEDKFLKSLRQFRGIYDPEILATIPKDCSKAYPKLTRWKIIGTVARLMQMLFPSGDKNYNIGPSPLPDLSTEQLQEVLDKLVAAKSAEQQIPPEQVECTDEEIEKAIGEFAKGKAERMALKVEDDLKQMEYETLARKVVFSAVLYNVGVLKGPMHVKKKARTWKRNQFTGKYEAMEIDTLKPVYEFMPVWGWYPDMTAVSLDKQDGEFERHPMTRSQVEELAKRPDFMADRVMGWLDKNKSGNYRARDWETIMKSEPKSDRTNAQGNDGRKYEVLSYWGDVTGNEIKAAGIDVKEEDLGKSFRADVWMIDKTVIKCKLSHLGEESRMYHVFVFEDDDLSLLGNGQADTLRDSQFAICEATRMLLDEASKGGENTEVNTDLLTPGQDYDPRSHKVWLREGNGNEASMPAVRPVQRQSRLAELQNVVAMFKDFADNESGLPPPSLGDVSGGGSEALRTQKGASMFLGAAALPIRDTVRNFDTFTISVIKSLVKWNMKYDPNASRDGDHDIIARGSTSLIAKEVLAQSLDLFASTVAPEDMPHIKRRKLLVERMKARDLPAEDLLEDEDKANQIIAQQQQAGQAAQQSEMQKVEAMVEELVTRAFKNAAQARQADASITTENFKALTGALTDGSREGGKAEAGASST